MKNYRELARSLITERRTKEIGLETAQKYFDNNVRDLWHPEQNTHIYRGVVGFDSNYGFVDPKSEGRRRSKNAENYYTLMIDNFSSWSQYPERSLSIVCTTDAGYAASMGRSFDQDGHTDGYLVLPVNSGKIGICSDDDIWRSFNIINDNFSTVHNLNDFNNLLEVLSGFVFLEDRDIPGGDFQKFKQHIERIERVGRQKERFQDLLEKEFGKYAMLDEARTFVKKFLESGKSLLGYLEHLLNPNKNGFSIQEFGREFNVNGEKEVWTETPSLLVRNDYSVIKKLMGDYYDKDELWV